MTLNKSNYPRKLISLDYLRWDIRTHTTYYTPRRCLNWNAYKVETNYQINSRISAKNCRARFKIQTPIEGAQNDHYFCIDVQENKNVKICVFNTKKIRILHLLFIVHEYAKTIADHTCRLDGPSRRHVWSFYYFKFYLIVRVFCRKLKAEEISL